MRIAMLGAGAYGRALGGVLEKNGHVVIYYDPIIGLSGDVTGVDKTTAEADGGATGTNKANRGGASAGTNRTGVGNDVNRGSTAPRVLKNLGTCLKNSELAVMAAPSTAVAELVQQLPKELPLIVATKGILDTGVMRKFARLMVLSGPGFATEIEAEKPTRLTATDTEVARLFATKWLSFDLTDDVTGVLMCGALKNAYAIGAGCRGLERGTQKWQEYITEVAEEMQALLSANGAEAATVQLSCGIGDLELTCGEGSRNYAYGQQLRDGRRTPEGTVEGISTLEQIKAGVIEVPEAAKTLREIIEVVCR